MRDRLIELIEDIQCHPEKTCPHFNDEDGCINCKYNTTENCNATERYADYLLKNGAIVPMIEDVDIVPPIKLGDITYRISTENPETGEDEVCVRENGKISIIAISKNGIFIYDDNPEYIENMLVKVNSEYAMLSREQAKEKLKEMQNETD